MGRKISASPLFAHARVTSLVSFEVWDSEPTNAQLHCLSPYNDAPSRVHIWKTLSCGNLKFRNRMSLVCFYNESPQRKFFQRQESERAEDARHGKRSKHQPRGSMPCICSLRGLPFIFRVWAHPNAIDHQSIFWAIFYRSDTYTSWLPDVWVSAKWLKLLAWTLK